MASSKTFASGAHAKLSPAELAEITQDGQRILVQLDEGVDLPFSSRSSDRYSPDEVNRATLAICNTVQPRKIFPLLFDTYVQMVGPTLMVVYRTRSTPVVRKFLAVNFLFQLATKGGLEPIIRHATVVHPDYKQALLSVNVAQLTATSHAAVTAMFVAHEAHSPEPSLVLYDQMLGTAETSVAPSSTTPSSSNAASVAAALATIPDPPSNPLKKRARPIELPVATPAPAAESESMDVVVETPMGFAAKEVPKSPSKSKAKATPAVAPGAPKKAKASVAKTPLPAPEETDRDDEVVEAPKSAKKTPAATKTPAASKTPASTKTPKKAKAVAAAVVETTSMDVDDDVASELEAPVPPKPVSPLSLFLHEQRTRILEHASDNGMALKDATTALFAELSKAKRTAYETHAKKQTAEGKEIYARELAAYEAQQLATGQALSGEEDTDEPLQPEEELLVEPEAPKIPTLLRMFANENRASITVGKVAGLTPAQAAAKMKLATQTAFEAMSAEALDDLTLRHEAISAEIQATYDAALRAYESQQRRLSRNAAFAERVAGLQPEQEPSYSSSSSSSD